MLKRTFFNNFRQGIRRFSLSDVSARVSNVPLKHILQFSRTSAGSICCVTPNTTVMDCSEVLSLYNVAALLVVNPAAHYGSDPGLLLSGLTKTDVVGVVSERDIARIYAHSSADFATVSEIMSQGVIFACPNTDLDVAMKKMLESNIRHLPIAEEEKLVGFLSMKDVLHAIAYASEDINCAEQKAALEARSRQAIRKKIYPGAATEDPQVVS